MAQDPKTGLDGERGEGPKYAQEGGLSLFLKLFIVPALIVAAALGVFLLGTLAVQKPKTAEQYLRELRSDSTNKRWQAAFEISKALASGNSVEFDDSLRVQLVKAFQDGEKDDPRLRAYLALVLGNLKEKRAVPVLVQALEKAEPDVKLYSLWALGNIGDDSCGAAVLKYMEDGDRGVRRMAVGALSALRYKPARGALEKNLSDPSLELRYDSAVALARLKDGKALPVLMEMTALKADEQTPAALVQSAKLAALEGFKELKDRKLRERVVALSKEDPDLKVRQAALEALKK